MKLAELRDAVRVEGQHKQDSYSATLDRLINEYFRKYTGRNRYPELHVSQYLLNVIGNGQSTFTLPANYQLADMFYYNDRSISIRGATSNPNRAHNILPNGELRYAKIAGNELNVFPSDQIRIGDVLNLSYYRSYPLLLDTDEHPVRVLDDVVIAEVTARLYAITDTNKQLAYKQIAKDSFAAARSEYAGR